MTRLHTRSISTWFWCAWWFATRNTASISDVLFVGAGDSVKLLCYSGGTAGDVAFNAGITATLINSSDKAKKAHSRRHVTPEQDHSRLNKSDNPTRFHHCPTPASCWGGAPFMVERLLCSGRSAIKLLLALVVIWPFGSANILAA